MMKKSFVNNVQFKIIFSLFVSVIFVLLIYYTCGIWFETNDDVFLSELLSGKITGSTEYHCHFVSSIITLPISILYRTFAQVPWWGLFLFLMYFISIYINVFCVVSKGNNLLQIMLFTFIEMCIFVAGIHCFGQAQFTCVAMLIAFAGYAILINLCEGDIFAKKTIAIVVFIVCELLACALRDSSMLLVQPVCLGALFGIEYHRYDTRIELNRILKKLIFAVVTVIISIVIVKLAHVATFSSPEWNNFLKFSEMRVYAMDYQTRIPADKFADILDEYGVTEDDFEMMTDHKIWFADGNLPDECLDRLITRYKEMRRSVPDVAKLFEGTKQLLFTSSEFWNLHRITAFMFIIVLGFIIISRRPKDLISLGLIFGGYLLGIVFLAYRDRFVLRVMMPYYMGTMLILFFFLLTLIHDMSAVIKSNKKQLMKDEIDGEKIAYSKKMVLRSRIPMIMSGILGMVLIVPIFISGRMQFAYVRAQNHKVNNSYIQIMKEISDYCKAHPENSYVLDMGYARFISTDIFETDYYQKSNYVYSGSWCSNTPTLMDYSAEYVGNDLCYLTYEAQEYIGMEGVEYYARKLNTQPVEEDSFKLVNGATMHVYRIRQ